MKCPKCHFDNPDDTFYCGKCATQLKPAEEKDVSVTKTISKPSDELSIGSTFAGRYQIVGELGRGGMGVVYKAGDSKLKRTVALKFLPPELTDDPEARDRFIREAQAAAALSYPNICTIYEIDEAEGKTFIAMEYVEGKSLAEKIKPAPLKLDEALDIALQVAEGLEEAHKKGIIHRDIKSANIMVTEKGQAKIMDFGLAKVAGGTLITKEAKTMGTVAYMSPEQARGETVDHRTDIWSLGVVLYEILSGQLPFKGEREPSVIHSIIYEKPKPLKAVNPDIPEELEQVIRKALAKNPDERYQKMDEFLDDLYSLSKGFVPPKIKAAIRRARLSKKKMAYLYAGISGLLVLIIAAGIYFFALQGKAIASIAVLPFENVSGDPEIEYLSEGITENLIIKLSQLPNLKKVINRNSVFTYKGQTIDPKKVGEELGVKAVLTSRMIKRGEELSVSVSLINTKDSRLIWGEKYTQRLEDIFSIEEEMAKAIIQALQLRLKDEEKGRITKRYSENAEAYNLYLKGRYFWNMRTSESIEKGMAYFQQAIEKDQTYALAYAGLADSYNRYTYYGHLSPEDGFPKARAYAEKALEIDSNLAEAHQALGYVSYIYDWDWTAAESRFKKAIELNPNYADAHLMYAVYLGLMERFDEDIQEVRRTLEIDPLYLTAQTLLGEHLRWAGRLDEAEEEHRKVFEMNPTFGPAHFFLGMLYSQEGKHTEALTLYQNAIKYGYPWANGALGYTYAMLGERDKAYSQLNELEQQSKKIYIPSSSMALIYLGLGEIDKVFEWFEKAYEERDTVMPTIKIIPGIDSIRSDLRFKALLKKMNFE